MNLTRNSLFSFGRSLNAKNKPCKINKRKDKKREGRPVGGLLNNS